MTVFCTHNFPVLSLSLHNSTSISAWTSLLTCPGDVELLQLYSRVGKPDVHFLLCGSCSVTEANRYFEIPERLSRLNSHGYYIQVTVCIPDKKVVKIIQKFTRITYLSFIYVYMCLFIYLSASKQNQAGLVLKKEFKIINQKGDCVKLPHQEIFTGAAESHGISQLICHYDVIICLPNTDHDIMSSRHGVLSTNGQFIGSFGFCRGKILAITWRAKNLKFLFKKKFFL